MIKQYDGQYLQTYWTATGNLLDYRRPFKRDI